MPLMGQSRPEAAAQNGDTGAQGQRLALEMLLRIWQQSEELPHRRAALATVSSWWRSLLTP